MSTRVVMLAARAVACILRPLACTLFALHGACAAYAVCVVVFARVICCVRGCLSGWHGGWLFAVFSAAGW